VNAYLKPVVDHSTTKFSWCDPDIVGLRMFMKDHLGWEESEVDRHLLPVMKELGQKRKPQTRIDGYFTVRYEDDKRAGKFQSKRLAEATRALRRKKDQKILSVDTMLENAPKHFDKVFKAPRESLNFVLSKNDKEVSSALSSLVASRIVLEKSEEDKVEETNEQQSKTIKMGTQIACMKYLEKMMREMLAARGVVVDDE
jgi:hypothetical protein